MATYITDDELKVALQAHLKEKTLGDIPASALLLLTPLNEQAAGLIRAKLADRGFTPAQIDSWDMAAHANRDQGCYYLMRAAANLSADDVWVEKLNWEDKLNSFPIAIDGVVVFPNAGGYISGRLSNTDQLVRATGDKPTEW
jgi:hypothetical protein